jgi:hypothetical protein
MQRHISFLTLALLLSGSVACSSSDDAPVTEDTGTVVDSSPVDTGKVVTDTGSETAPMSCAEDLPQGYACPTVTKAASSSACSEAALQAFATACVQADLSVGPDCAAWRAANAACNTCVEAWSFDDGKVYPDDYVCYEYIKTGCGSAIACEADCYDTVCTSCSDTEYGPCADEATKMGGRCYELASKTAGPCFDDPKAAPCDVTQYYVAKEDIDLAKLKTEVVRLLRGACRDNGDFTKTDSAGTGDAGTGDTGTGDAATDSGTPSDAASDGG